MALIQRFGSAANLNIHLLCLVLAGVYRCDADGIPALVHCLLILSRSSSFPARANLIVRLCEQ